MTSDTPFLPETEVRDLITRAQGGDREAFARVIEQVRPFIYKLARQFAKRAGGVPVEDLVQTGLLAAVKSVPCFKTGRRGQVRQLRRGGRPPGHPPGRVRVEAAPPGGRRRRRLHGRVARPVGPGPDRPDAETATEVRNLVDAHLGDRERRLLGQRFGLDGSPPRTYAELATVTGTSRQNVQQLVERALRRLRTAMSDVMNA